MLVAPALTTPRLILTPLTVADAEEMPAVYADPRMHEFTGGVPPTAQWLRARYAHLERGGSPDGAECWLNWIVRTHDDPQPIGTVQATVAADRSWARVAWEVGVRWQGAGVATEAAGAMVAWLVSAGVTTIDAAIAPGHHASERVATRLGLAPLEEVDDGETVWRRSVASRDTGLL